MNDLPGFAAKLNTAASALAGPAMRGVLTKVGVEAKKDLEDASRAALGGDSVMSNWKRAKLSAGFEQSGSSLTFQARPAGPWRVVESGAGRHMIRPKRKRRGGVLRIGPREFAASVQHPGTRGKRAWSKGVTTVRKNTGQRASDLIEAELRKVLL